MGRHVAVQNMANDDNSVPLSWVLLFVALALGAGVAAVLFTGGSLMAELVVPLF